MQERERERRRMQESEREREIMQESEREREKDNARERERERERDNSVLRFYLYDSFSFLLSRTLFLLRQSRVSMKRHLILALIMIAKCPIAFTL